jgi:hypothetical protein
MRRWCVASVSGQRFPITLDVSPATMLIKPALLSPIGEMAGKVIVPCLRRLKWRSRFFSRRPPANVIPTV